MLWLLPFALAGGLFILLLLFMFADVTFGFGRVRFWSMPKEEEKVNVDNNDEKNNKNTQQKHWI